MRPPASRLLLLLVLALFASVASEGRAHADPKAEARTHYQAGQKLYASGDYRGAITEFSAAQQLMPADLNNYNLALCYDKLGDAEPAVQYYREYLNKQPNAANRAEIEASVARLEAALKSASAKRDEAKKAEDARKAQDARNAPSAPPAVVAPEPGGPAMSPDAVGSTGAPATGQAVSTGDAQLDRVAAIDVNGVRDQRVGGAASGMPAAGASGPQGPPPPAGAAAAPNGAQGPGGPGPDQEPPKKPTPVYKKWWFWAVVAVSAYVVYSIATEGSNSTARMLPETGGAQTGPTGGGATLLRF